MPLHAQAPDETASLESPSFRQSLLAAYVRTGKDNTLSIHRTSSLPRPLYTQDELEALPGEYLDSSAPTLDPEPLYTFALVLAFAQIARQRLSGPSPSFRQT